MYDTNIEDTVHTVVLGNVNIKYIQGRGTVGGRCYLFYLRKKYYMCDPGRGELWHTITHNLGNPFQVQWRAICDKKKYSASVCASYCLILDIFSKFRPWLMKCSKKNFVLYDRFEFKQKSCSRLYPMSQYLNNVSITNTSISSIALLTITPLESKIPLSLYAIV